MGKIYDNWGRLVGAILNREKLWELAHAPSLSSTSSDSRSPIHNHIPVNPEEKKSNTLCKLPVFAEIGGGKDVQEDYLWQQMKAEARRDIDQAPIFCYHYFSSILSRGKCFYGKCFGYSSFHEVE